MNIRDIAFLACRLFALYAFYILILNVTILVDKIGIEIFRDNLNRDSFVSTKGFFGAILLYLSATLLLWFGAPFLSKFLAPKVDQTARDAELEPLNSTRLLAIAIIFLGLYLVCTIAATFFSYVITSLLQGNFVWDYGLISFVFQIFVGFILIIGGGTIARLISRLRNWE